MDDRRDVAARLGENGIAFAEVRVGTVHSAIVPARGGHLLGPFDDRTGESVLWLNPAFSDPGAFRALLERADWNLGGMRLWVAPEIRFGVADRRRYWETLVVQPDMEPAALPLETGADGTLSTSYALALTVHNPPSGVKRLHVGRRIRRLPDPLARLSRAAGDGLEYFGFAHDVAIRQEARDGVPAEAWNLLQVRGGGIAIVPTTGAFDYADYYEPLETSHWGMAGSRVRLRLDGGKRFKIGVRSHCHFGRMGYLLRADGRWELLVCNYYNDPGAFHAEQPDNDSDCRGLSMHFYNDGGMFGGFGELEANGRTLGLNGYPDAVEDSFSVWCWRGGEAGVKRMAMALLGDGGSE